MKPAHLALLPLLVVAAASAAEFVPPPPGTYELHHIMPAPSGTVLDERGAAAPLSRFTTGRVTLLSLIYTRCRDGMGCPLATHQLQHLKGILDAQPEAARRVRFVSLSFDPDRDTPAVMRSYGRTFNAGSGGVPWHFLTTRSRSEVKPIVHGFGQDLWSAREGDALAHVLKLFLIDARGSVREIYSTSFLHTQVVLNDIETLLLENAPMGASAPSALTRRSAATSAR
jgi:cytochrome oxidase Cu insertion factor (SCO1/SenC/PrrC family)